MKTVILVPRRDDNGWRDGLWKFCRARWEKTFPEWSIYEGYHYANEGPFNRSQAVNRAAAMGGDWDVALIIDSDTISDPEAVQRTVDHAYATGIVSVAHDTRYMLNERGTKHVMSGAPGTWSRKPNVKTIYRDSVSCAVAVRRDTWDMVGGFDERFVGWGFEDTAFQVACETLTGKPFHHERADCFHLWHQESPEASHESPTYWRNRDLKVRYLSAHWQPERVRAVLGGRPDPGQQIRSIPKILHRTVPENTSAEVEGWWRAFADLHPTWEMRTYRDPIDPAEWPLTGDLFAQCQNGAQKAGLIRLEALVTYGGIYVDSDVEPIRPLDPLLHLPAFAAWEDERVVPDAVLGAMPNHPAFLEMLSLARRSIESGEDAWKSGPGVSTAVLPGRDDVLVLPPGAFYPAHYKEKSKLGTNAAKPWVFLEHKWHHSWASTSTKAMNVDKQRPLIMPGPAIVVQRTDVSFAMCMPWRDSGDVWRRNAHKWCVAWWQRAGFPVFEGPGSSRSEMCNRAAAEALASGAEVLVFVDADTWTDYDQIVQAVETAKATGCLTHAFTTYITMGQSSTQRLQRRRDVNAAMAARGNQLRYNHVSGACAITVDLWREIGGFDERFVGWGFEDQAFNLAAGCMGGGVERVAGHGIHWYHKNDPTKGPLQQDDPRVALIERYCIAAGTVPEAGRVSRLARNGTLALPDDLVSDPEMMRALLSDVGGPLSAASVG